MKTATTEVCWVVVVKLEEGMRMAGIRPHWRKMSWVVVIWNVLMVIWIIAGVASASHAVNCNGISTQTCQAAADVGTGIGVTFILIVWVVGDFLLGILWLVTKPRGQRDCPVCGNTVKRGLTVCRSCGHDFAKGVATS